MVCCKCTLSSLFYVLKYLSRQIIADDPIIGHKQRIILIVASDKGLSSEWRVYLFLPKLGEKNYYYECDVGRTMVYYP
jgi:hypothetical protein